MNLFKNIEKETIEKMYFNLVTQGLVESTCNVGFIKDLQQQFKAVLTHEVLLKIEQKAVVETNNFLQQHQLRLIKEIPEWFMYFKTLKTQTEPCEF